MNKTYNKKSGWNFRSFILGPFWYLSNGLITKGIVLLFISIITFGLGVPIIWFYCGFRGNSDYYEKTLKERSLYDTNKF